LSGYIALQLAREVADSEHVSKYLALVDHQPLLAIIDALSKAKARQSAGANYPANGYHRC
jgi:hypothetical protein